MRPLFSDDDSNDIGRLADALPYTDYDIEIAVREYKDIQDDIDDYDGPVTCMFSFGYGDVTATARLPRMGGLCLPWMIVGLCHEVLHAPCAPADTYRYRAYRPPIRAPCVYLHSVRFQDGAYYREQHLHAPYRASGLC